MSTHGQPQQAQAGQPGSNRAVYDTIDYVYNHNVEGDLGANGQVQGGDYTRVEGDDDTDNNEVMEVVKIEYIPPQNADDSLQRIDHIRLWDGDDLYSNLRYRPFMMGYFGGDDRLTTPPLGQAVLSGQANPDRAKFNAATPKFGTSTTVSPRLQNNGTAITDSFRIRLHVWRWKGSQAEFQDFFQDTYGQTTFRQNVSISNPFTGNSANFERASPIRIKAGGNVDAHRQFTKLMGGINQETPKAYPWVTWSENNNATSTNQEYEFSTAQQNVDVSWKQLEFDLTDGNEARIFDYVMVNERVNLDEGVLVFDERDEDPNFQLSPNDAHELPVVQPLDGRQQPHDADQLPVNLRERLAHRQVLWDDGGGFRIVDDGNQIPATPGNRVLIGVQGVKLVLST